MLIYARTYNQIFFQEIYHNNTNYNDLDIRRSGHHHRNIIFRNIKRKFVSDRTGFDDKKLGDHS